jgi:cytoskeletal protein RodZ
MSAAAPTLGERLKTARESKGFSTQKAALQLHLDPWVVEALESGDYDRIGPAVYGKGHLKRYAALLDLPADELLDAYPDPRASAASNGLATGLLPKIADADGYTRPWAPAGGLVMAGGLVLAMVVAGVAWFRPWLAHTALPAINFVQEPKAPTAETTHSARDGAGDSAVDSTGDTAGDGARDSARVISRGVPRAVAPTSAEALPPAAVPAMEEAPPAATAPALTEVEPLAPATGLVGQNPRAKETALAKSTGLAEAEPRAKATAEPEPRAKATAEPEPRAKATAEPEPRAKATVLAEAKPLARSAALAGQAPLASATTLAGPAPLAKSTVQAKAAPLTAAGALAATEAHAAAAHRPKATAGLGQARLRLRFSADSWVVVHDADGRRVFAGNGRANSVENLVGAAPMTVYLGFASGVQLEINDHAVAIGRQFMAGDVARFTAGADGVLRRDPPHAAAQPRPRG